MGSFKMQERDLDLFLLEELCCNTAFSRWFAERMGIKNHSFRDAEHSVSAKINAKWGETDVLAFFVKDNETIAVLIEDKIAADFADRQADRYHERGAQLVGQSLAHRYTTVLIAPTAYLSRVPKDDRWDTHLSMETLRDWFASDGTAHACWRASALTECIASVERTKRAKNSEILRASNEFASFLKTQPEQFNHKPTDDRWGFIVGTPSRKTHVQYAWKFNKSLVDLTFGGPLVGMAGHITLPSGVRRQLSDGVTLKSDILSIEVPFVEISESLEKQSDVLTAVANALRELMALASMVLAERPV